MYRYAVVVLAAFLLPSAPVAAQQNAWKYPCDVYIPGACTHLPGGLELRHSIPADFATYELINAEGKVLLNAYTRMAPFERPEGRMLRLSDSGVELSAYANSKGRFTRLDIFIERRGSQTLKTHIVANVDSATDDTLAKFVAGLRPCRTKISGALLCIPNRKWSEELAHFVASAQKT